MSIDTSDPARLDDRQLTAALVGLAARERSATAALVAHLAVFDVRGLHLGLGYSSLFAYCCEALRLSEHEAYNRIEAARVSRQHPQVLTLMREGALTLTAVRLLAPVLNDQNVDRLLAAGTGCSKRRIEELVAREAPQAGLPDRVRKLPVRAPSLPDPGPADPAEEPAPTAAVHQTASPRPAASERPLSCDRYEVRFTASATTCEKLRQARDLLRHAVPGGETAEIVDRALTLLLGHLLKEKFATTRRPRPGAGPSAHARTVGASVKRAVHERDGGRCAFIASSGRRCDARALLEFHHVKPWAGGGPGTVENVQLRCRAHNQHEARLHFGPILEARQRDHQT